MQYSEWAKCSMLKFQMLFLALFVLVAMPAQADAISKLNEFVTATHAEQAGFTQIVLDKSGKRLQSASGTMQFVRPGKFRWVYQQPYQQIIVGDGVKFWMYDVDLNQVTVKKLDATLGSSPAALLSGSNQLDRDFSLQDVGEKDQLFWLQATPKNSESSFQTIRMGFNSQSDLMVMELRDTFGRNTVLKFTNVQRNPALAPDLFKFVPPKGADVLGE